MRNGKQKRTRNDGSVAIEESCGNVFADIGLPNADELLAKAPLVQRVDNLIQERGLSIKQAAVLLDVKPTQLTKLLSGKLDQFTLYQLFQFLNALGQEVEIVVRPAKYIREKGETRVAARCSASFLNRK